MAQTPEGARKGAAKRLGMDLDAYTERVERGEKYCTGCREWHPVSAFGKDASRSDGLAAMCRKTRGRKAKATYRPRPRESTMGARFAPARDGDREQARARVNLLVRTGRLPRPNDMPCFDCGARWREGQPRHEYDHHLGYAAEHQEHVQAVCRPCHRKRDEGRAASADRARDGAGRFVRKGDDDG